MDLATPDGAQEEPGEDVQILEEASAVAVYDASQVPGASELAVYNGQEVPGGANKCLNSSPSERRRHSKTSTPTRTRRDRWSRRQSMFAIRAASGLVQMRFWCCDTWGGFGLPMIVASVPMGCHISAVNQSSVPLRRTLHSQDGISGKPITLPVPLTPALRRIGMAIFGPKPGCHDAMMHHA